MKYTLTFKILKTTENQRRNYTSPAHMSMFTITREYLPEDKELRKIAEAYVERNNIERGYEWRVLPHYIGKWQKNIKLGVI